MVVKIMSARKIVCTELATLLKTLANSERIRIIEELRLGAQDVSTLQSKLDVSNSNTSQHLSILKSRKLVKEKRQGKHKIHSLVKSDIADWLIEGLDYLESEMGNEQALLQAVDEVKKIWTS